jgi:hypothetical protein
MPDIQEWLQAPGNLERYQAWRDDPITKLMLEGVQLECRPRLIPANAVSGEMSLYLHGQTIGEHRVLHRLRNLDSVEPSIDKLVSIYGMTEYLKERGYKPEQINKMLKDEGYI